MLLLDRLGDPVSPLVTPWTYQAMVMEILSGGDKGVVSASAEANQFHFSVLHDELYAKVCSGFRILIHSRCDILSQLGTCDWGELGGLLNEEVN